MIKNIQQDQTEFLEIKKFNVNRIFGNGKKLVSKCTLNGLNYRLDTIEERIIDLKHRDAKKIPRMWQRKQDRTHKNEVKKCKKSEKI